MRRRNVIIGMLAGVGLVSFYVAVMSLDGGLGVTLQNLGREWWIITGIVLAFGTQVALYTQVRANTQTLRMQTGIATGAVTATTSAGSMLACCLHHATDVLPLVGITAIATFFGEIRAWLFGIAYLSSAIGIVIMLRSLRHQRHALNFQRLSVQPVTSTNHGPPR